MARDRRSAGTRRLAGASARAGARDPPNDTDPATAVARSGDPVRRAGRGAPAVGGRRGRRLARTLTDVSRPSLRSPGTEPEISRSPAPDRSTAVGRRGGLERREPPATVDDLVSWSVEAHEVVPSVGDREDVRQVVGVFPEPHGRRAVRVADTGHAVDRVDAGVVRLEEAVAVVHRDRPEPVDRDVPDSQAGSCRPGAAARRRRRRPRPSGALPSLPPCRSGDGPGRPRPACRTCRRTR